MTIRPASVAELCQLVKEASAARQPVYPVGGDTQSHWLAPISKPGLTVDMTGIPRLIDFPAEDMTVTVEAGMTLLALQRILHEKRMWLPLDVPDLERATVGGSLAANLSGPRQTGFGTWRDYVLGLHWVNDRGDEVKAGGRVVKNVAGYDFCKLLIGSFGTLGILTQITLKVKPLPEACAVVTGSISDNAMESWSQRWRKSGLRSTVCVLSKQSSNSWNVTIGLEEGQEAVSWQLAEITPKLLADADVVEGQAARNLLSSLATTLQPNTELGLFLQLPAGHGAAVASRLAAESGSVNYHPCTGVISVSLTTTSLDEARLQVSQLREEIPWHGGHAVLAPCPPAWRSALQPFGPTRPDWKLMRHIKQTLDPHNLFQPDRYEVLHGE